MVSKAQMIAKFKEILNLKVDMSTNPAGLATQYKSMVDELCEMGITFGYDDLLPLVIHDAVAVGSPLRQELDRRIDAEMSNNGHHPLTFEHTWRTLSQAIAQVRSMERLDSPQNVSSFMSTTVQGERSPSITSHPDNVYAMATGPPRRMCFRCKSTGHLIGQCTAPDVAPSRPANYPQYQQQTFGAPPFRAYYPILAPTGPAQYYYPQ